MATEIKDLAAEVNKRLAQFAGATDDVVKKSVDTVAKATVSRLKETSPKRTGEYAAAWTSRVDRSQPHVYNRIVYSKDHAHLTHLLEDGHQIVTRTGAKKGFVKAYPHIKAAEEAAIKEFETMLRQGVEAIK